MRSKILLLAGGVIFICGCSSSTKKSDNTAGAAAPAVAVAKVEVPAKIQTPQNEMICSRGGEKRRLEVESVQPKGCKLWYSRYEAKSTVATSVLGNTHCEQVREKIRTNLIQAGFECMTVMSGEKS